eukprot:5374428-Prymnesium_polylepis.1
MLQPKKKSAMTASMPGAFLPLQQASIEDCLPRELAAVCCFLAGSARSSLSSKSRLDSFLASFCAR